MTEQQKIRIDLVSDVVCPWCAVGYKQLEQALAQTGLEVDIHWQPFQLNPNMVAEGENLREHLMNKYGISEADSVAARQRLKDVGDELGFAFNFSEESRIFNTMAAHQLLHWAKQYNLQQTLKLALFSAYFSDQKDISDPQILLAIVAEVGLDSKEAETILKSEDNRQQVQEDLQRWQSQGISSVPSMVFNNKYLVSGAQGIENYVSILTQIKNEMEA